ncbi:DUF4760 domain-containing protein [Paenibacillus eucommiae]|uniref:DUF4760 domain-containing protein n=1 Tax=Paenibacillus eucommiae TaxID=1355755 RepID=A0ABS4J1W1_9BACL|nr:hypothetical protein [Paenibacillus eucommiae]MBP1993241.1 hypothetical protein [Paenibacillus eucommiae]
MSWLTDIRPILETLSFLASICLAATIVIGLRQLKLLKEDMFIKNKRASVEKSIEFLNWFATDFLPKHDEYVNEVKKKEAPLYEGPRNENFVFDSNCNLSMEPIKDHLQKSIDSRGADLLNQLEYFSAALLSGLADEELAFNPLAHIYCSIIEGLYVVLCYYRDEESKTMFTNIVTLHKMWKDRLEKMKMEIAKNKLIDDISKIKDTRIKGIGL